MNLSKKIFKTPAAMLWLIGLAASLLASALLLDLHNTFYVDWTNHLWAIRYFGESLKHFSVPAVLNTQQMVGIPVPLFYAQKFYALAGCLSAFWGPALAIRLMVLGVFLLQFFQVYRAGVRTGTTPAIALSISVMVTWAIYPLTNLYNRSALTEFFAVALLTAAACSFLCVVLEKKPCFYDKLAVGLYFTAAAVTHPLTALFGGWFLAILGIISLIFCEAQKRLFLFRYFFITAVFSLLALSPWLYILHLFNGKLPVFSQATNTTYFQSQYFFPNSIDNIFSRLSPFPLDMRSIQQGAQVIATPYLDAQITLPLFILSAVFIYISRQSKKAFSVFEAALIIGCVCMLAIAFIESICPKALDFSSGFFDTLQFPYRLVTYVNLAGLVILLMLARNVDGNTYSKQLVSIVLALCLGLSFCALVQKLVHGQAIAQPSAELPATQLPSTYYGAQTYSIKEGFEKGDLPPGQFRAVIHNFNVSEGAHFGEVEPMTVELNAPGLVVTNLQPFPWNHMVVNGILEPPFTVLSVNGRGAVFLPPGRYEIGAVSLVDGTWKFLNILSWVVFLAWMAALVAFSRRGR